MSYRKSLLLIALTLAAGTARADEWPKWRGPNGDGISHETGLLDKWPEAGPTKLWSAKVGLGFSSPIANDGKIYLLSEDKGVDGLQCFDAETGKMIWVQSSPGGYPKDDYPGARATPTIDGKFIYTYGGGGNLICRDLDTGKEVWRINVLQKTHSGLLTWGQASSPLVTDKAIYVQSGEGGPIAVAIDKTNGNIAWTSEFSGAGGYAAPILMNVNGVQQLIVFGGDALFGMNPETGKTLWSTPWQTQYGVNASTPIVKDDKIFIGSGYNQGVSQYQVTATGIKQLWIKKDITCKFPGTVLDNGYLYLVSEDHNGTLKCLDWNTGAIKWSATGGREIKMGFGGSFVRDGDKLYTMSQNGLLSLMSADPQGVKLISQTQAFDAGFAMVWSTPLLYHGKLYAKGRSELVCLDISGKSGTPQ
jgi:outer membrane protein assembly factor BamB